jgi:uncharacterized protein (TIGR02466 family)
MSFDPTKDIIIEELWPTYMYIGRVKDIDNEKIAEWILDYKKNTETRKFSNQGGWQESISDYQHDPIFKDYIQAIVQTLKITKLKLTKETQLSIHSWANVNEKGNWNLIHNHPGTDLSGVYYVKVPKNSGEILFFDPRKLDNVNAAFEEQPKIIGSHPVEGNLFLFPPYLEHMVTPSESDETRISIAFNIVTK